MVANRKAWLRALGEFIDHKAGRGVYACVDCGQQGLNVRYVVKAESRVGYALFWCNACLHGISISRVRAPEGCPVWSIDDDQSLAGVPEFLRHE